MRVLVLILMLVLPFAAQAQESDAGFLARQVEDALSGDGRTVRLNGVSGLLSSSATVKEITVADEQGVWLRISDAAIDWTRLDLLRGRLTVNKLAAGRIEIYRAPAADISVTPEAPTIAIPVLPVAVNVREFRVGKLVFDAGVFGLASELSAEGDLAMVNGGLDLNLRAERLDQPGQALLDVAYDAASDNLDFNLVVSEPPGGMIANALNLRGEPAIDFSLTGTGPVAGLDLDLSLKADGTERVAGVLALNRQAGLLGLKGEVTAEIGTLVAGPAGAMFAGPVRLAFDARDRGSDWEITHFGLSAAGLGLEGQGVASMSGFDGRMALSAGDLALMQPLTGAGLAGRAEFGLEGRIGFPNGDFDLKVSGQAEGLVTGVPALDGVLGGQTDVSGSLQRDAGGVHAQGLRLEGTGGSVTLEGSLSSADVAASVSAELANIGDLGLPVSGPARLDMVLSGDPAAPSVSGTAELGAFTLQGRGFDSAELHFDGVLGGGGFDGIAAAGVVVQGLPVRVSGRVLAGPEGVRLSGLVGQAASLNLNGGLSLTNESGLSGELTGSLRDLSDFSGIAGVEMAGAAELIGISLRPADGVSATAFLSSASAFGLQAGDTGLQLGMKDGALQATVSARALTGHGLALHDLRLAAAGTAQEQKLELNVSGPGQLALTAGAVLIGRSGTRELNFTSADLRTPGGVLSLTAPAVLQQVPGGFSLTPATVLIGGGSLTLGGTFADQSDAKLVLSSVPLAMLQPFLQPTLPGGSVSGTAVITGPMAAPVARFDLNSANLTAPGLQQGGIGTFSARASGTATTGEIRFDSFSANGAVGLSLQGAGQVSLTGGSLDIRAEGKVPLGLIGAFSAGRFEASGAATASLRARGTLAAPDLQGSVGIAGATFTDLSSNLRLNQVNMSANFKGSDLVISSASARSSAGGGLTVTGRIGFAGGRLAPDMVLTLNNLAWADGKTIYARLDGQLLLRPAGGGSLLSGTLALGETLIVIPDNTGGLSSRGIPDVAHYGQSAAVQTTLDRVKATMPDTSGGGFASRLSVDISVSAPGHIFVRGRGLDAEMRGSMRITGPVSDVSPVGSFEMIRGRLDFLARRFEFSEGRITLQGNFDPVIAFRAEAQSADVTVHLNLSGSASDPDFSLTSSPELPEDEVLARLIFDRGFGELTAAQTIQLASAVRELNGGRDSGVFSRIRRATSLDDLDFTTDEEGSWRVRAGKYIDDNIYLDVEARSRGETRATISMDLNPNFTAKATAGTDGETSIGLFYQNDY